MNKLKFKIIYFRIDYGGRHVSHIVSAVMAAIPTETGATNGTVKIYIMR